MRRYKLIRIKHLTCPICEGNMESTNFNGETGLSNRSETIYKITYKCDRCNTFTTTYTRIKKGGVIQID